MNDELILLKCGEVALKGLNRRRFESTLLANLRHRLRRVGKFSCQLLQSTVTVTCLQPDDEAALVDEAVQGTQLTLLRYQRD